MSIFAEPSETLCGEQAVDRDAVCVGRAGHAPAAHIWNDVLVVDRYMRCTFTPCRWVGAWARERWGRTS